jgi:hypothetical protein
MSTVEEIVEAIRELSPEKRDEVRRQLVSLWAINSRHSAADLKSSALRIKRARPRRPPIHVKGKPISETVVEDRR